MARMIPPEVYPNCSSSGERDVFSMLKQDPSTMDWTVLHSLNLAHHGRQISGEIDFVVLVPRKGVLCVEVKGCSALRRDRGLWFYGSDAKGDARGPFKQASEAMHSLRRHVVRQDPKLGCVPFWSAVVFPYVQFSISSPEWHSWQAIDSADLKELSIGLLLTRTLESARALLATRTTARWFEAAEEHPSQEECLLLQNLLRPSFEVFESPGNRFQRIETELKKYTDEQFEALDAMAGNPQVLFNGPAGTGKTLLAIEAAKRSNAAGHRTLFLCFNRHLGIWLRKELASLQPLVMVRTLHSFMLETAGIQTIPQDAPEQFWQKALPQECLDRISQEPRTLMPFDEVIVDEAQDILQPQYLSVLNAVLHGGLIRGRFRFFGDFENQSIFGFVDPATIRALREGGCAQYTLRVNCRNLPRIASLASLLGGLTPDYKRVRRPDDGVKSEPTYAFYRDGDEQERHLLNTLEGLFDEGYRPSDIVMLSPKNERECLAAVVGNAHPTPRFSTLDRCPNNAIGYTTAHAFKGLEAPVVVLTDIEHLASAHDTALFYVAVTRALHRLVILIAESAKTDILSALSRKAAMGEEANVNSHC